jgi:hypothetical protein
MKSWLIKIGNLYSVKFISAYPSGAPEFTPGF